MNTKNQMNKKNKEFHVLKIAYNKLDEENRKNTKLIQEIIDDYEASKRDGNYDNINIQKLKEVKISNLVKYGYKFEETDM